MPTWILDDGPLGILARFADPNVAASWPQDFWVAEQTALDANDGNRAKLLEAGSIQTLHFDMGSRAAKILYEHLRDSASTSTTNLAEHQSIAWLMAEENDVIFVSCDRRAITLALAELGRGRVAHTYDLWLHLRDSEFITQEQFEKLCDATRKTDQSKIPARCQAQTTS